MKSVESFRRENSHKRFSEELSTAVFTTKFVINDRKEITYVTHEIEDGAWQFLSDDKFEDFETVARVVGLGELIKKDNSILELADLPLGFSATRTNRGDKWKVLENGK